MRNKVNGFLFTRMLALSQSILLNSSWQIEHPPYSLDLNPSHFFLLPRLKLALKEKRFDNILISPKKWDKAFELHPQSRLLAKFPGYV
ncbi:hypothetical protein TNCV_3776361 [Trichonephila clavipes]|nr:hypothetical protein TNCV_3776361 [Trichonephila clavipes]